MNILIKAYLKFRFGNSVTIGSNCRFSDIPDIEIKSGGKIIFGENVIVKKRCDLRAYDNSSIILGSNCKLDDNVRIIAANGNEVNIGDNVKIGFCSVLNGGGGISIGKNTSTYGYVYIQSSSHNINNKIFCKNSYSHQRVSIGDHCLISPFNKIGPGEIIEDSSII